MRSFLPLFICLFFGLFLVLLNKKNHSEFLEAAEVKALLAEQATVIDVRTIEEVEQGIVAGARHVPFDELETRLKELPTVKEQPIIVYCARGGRADLAKETLQRLGYTRVFNAGGYMDLKRMGL